MNAGRPDLVVALEPDPRWPGKKRYEVLVTPRNFRGGKSHKVLVLMLPAIYGLTPFSFTVSRLDLRVVIHLERDEELADRWQEARDAIDAAHARACAEVDAA